MEIIIYCVMISYIERNPPSKCCSKAHFTASSTSSAQWLGGCEGCPWEGSYTPVFTRTDDQWAPLAPAISKVRIGEDKLGIAQSCHSYRSLPDSGLSWLEICQTSSFKGMQLLPPIMYLLSLNERIEKKGYERRAHTWDNTSLSP